MANLNPKNTFSHRLGGAWLVSGLQEWQFIRHLDGVPNSSFSFGNLLDDI